MLTSTGVAAPAWPLRPDTVMLGDGGVAAAFVYRYQGVTAVEELIRDAGGAVPAVVRECRDEALRRARERLPA